jgi:hypothetical protein
MAGHTDKGELVLAIPERLLIPPDPVRMIEGLRDTGYKFTTAIADLIDNSIAAAASNINVSVLMGAEGQITLYIADDGVGMSKDALTLAMTYGSPVRPDPASLGRFGLGLKTASTAFCRRLSVISRSSGGDPFVKATWDLDHVAKVRSWELLISTPERSERKKLDEVAGTTSGTLVVWEKVDRFLKTYQDPTGGYARTALDRQLRALSQHLAMVYQRYLDPDDKRTTHKVQITLQGESVVSWDPFVAGESDLVATEQVVVELDGKRPGAFTVRAYILPRKEDFADPERADEARINNSLQGIYVYRENRLIYGPDWLSLFNKEPHFSLLRVEFSFDHSLDDVFHIDIKKSEIILNQDLLTWLDDFLNPARRAADDRYRQGQRRRAKTASMDAHDSSNANIHRKESALNTANVEILNKKRSEVMVENKEGQVRLKLTLSRPSKTGEFHVQPVAEIDDGLLWRPALIDTHKAVQINTSHPYYFKVYVPNLKSTVTVQGIDSLLWAFCMAELGTVNEITKQYFLDMRFEVSRLLRRLVDDLPDPKDLDN